MKLSLSGVTPFVIGELLIPRFRVLTEMSLRGGGLCSVFREGTCDDYIKLHSIFASVTAPSPSHVHLYCSTIRQFPFSGSLFKSTARAFRAN